MSVGEWVFSGLFFLLIPAVLVWVYRKRNRLFFSTKFTAETTMRNYQDDSKRAAMEAVHYMNEEAEEDEAGEKKNT